MTSTEKLEYIFDFVKSIKEGVSGPANRPSALGFQKSPHPDLVYIGEHEGHPWYKIVQDGGKNSKVAIPHNFIAGHLVSATTIEKKSDEYGDKLKFRIQLKCGDESVAIQSGLTTYFSRALLSGLCSLPSEFSFATSPIGIEVASGDKGKVTLPALYVMGAAGGWSKVKLDAANLTNEDEMAEAINSSLKPRL